VQEAVNDDPHFDDETGALDPFVCATIKDILLYFTSSAARACVCVCECERDVCFSSDKYCV
jgi:hypothetical protein